ncbi:MAG: UvrB/UvrC motif-containing protein, partial [Streptosporangiaceae bacterium]
DIVADIAREDIDTEQLLGSGYRKEKKGGGGDRSGKGKTPTPAKSTGLKDRATEELTDRPAAELAEMIEEMTDRMRAAAAELQFEVAARLRDEIRDLKHELRGMHAAGV